MASRCVQVTYIILVKIQESFQSQAAELNFVRILRHRTVSLKDSCKNTCHESGGIRPTVARVKHSDTYTIALVARTAGSTYDGRLKRGSERPLPALEALQSAQRNIQGCG